MAAVLLLTLLLSVIRPVMSGVHLNEVGVLPVQTVELINTGSESADISGWYVDDSGGSTFYTVPAGTLIPPMSCFVASAQFNFNATTADTVRLFDSSGPPTATASHLIDSFSYTRGPPENKTYVATPDGGSVWTEQPSSLGRWNAGDTSCIAVTPVPTAPPSPVTATENPTPTETQAQEYDNIFIEKVYPYPNTGEKEWVMLRNKNNFKVDLANWFIDDNENAGSSPKPFSVTIEPGETVRIELTSSIMNNDGDIVRLLSSGKNEKDSYEYTKCERGEILSALSTDIAALPTVKVELSLPQSPTVQKPRTYPMSTAKMSRTIRYSSVPASKNPPARETVLGISKSNTTAPTSRRRYLLLIPSCYAVLTLCSLFIKMNYA